VLTIVVVVVDGGCASERRQNLERQSSMQKLYGMEAEIAKKVEKKTEPLIEPMCKWLYEVVGEEGNPGRSYCSMACVSCVSCRVVRCVRCVRC
jgi:hypothetical protein